MRDYHINIFYSDDDEGYIADIPGLEAYSAFGVTPGEALHEVQKAKKLWIEAARSEGKPIRLPSIDRLYIRQLLFDNIIVRKSAWRSMLSLEQSSAKGYFDRITTERFSK